MEISIFQKAGFTSGEIKIYLALLELGETTTGPIIKKAKISSSKVYEILEKLIQKGLVSHNMKDKTKYFQAASPIKIKEYLKRLKKDFEDNEQRIEKILPELIEKQNLSEETQTASVYEGYEGVKTVFDKILSTLKRNEEYYVFTVQEEVSSEELRNFLLNYHTKRIKKGIKVKLLSNIKNKALIKKRYPNLKLSERKFIKKAFPNGVFIFKDHVMHLIYHPHPTLFTIKSRQNYENYKEFFLGLWKKAKK